MICAACSESSLGANMTCPACGWCAIRPTPIMRTNQDAVFNLIESSPLVVNMGYPYAVYLGEKPDHVGVEIGVFKSKIEAEKFCCYMNGAIMRWGGKQIKIKEE